MFATILHIYFTRFVALFSLIGLFVSVLASMPVFGQETAPPPQSVITYEQILHNLQDNGSLRMLINLDPSGEGQVSKLQEFAQSSSGEDAMMGEGFELPYLYETEQRQLMELLGLSREQVEMSQLSPLLTVEVESESELSAIFQKTPPEFSIEIDGLMTPSLDSSNPIIGATTSWNSGASGTGADQMIAILDTGVDRDHEFLQGRVVMEACFSTNSRFATSLCPDEAEVQQGVGAAEPCDLPGCGHGTHVAGIAAGSNEEIASRSPVLQSPQFNGVARGADLLAIQVFSRVDAPGAQGCGERPAPCIVSFQSDQLEAMSYLALVKVMQQRGQAPSNLAAINLSVGSVQATAGECDRFFRDMTAAITNLKDLGVASVVAAGNSGLYGVAMPACITSAVSVGNVLDDGRLHPGSNRHATVDIYAPGSRIGSSAPDNQYALMTGTSMSAPAVSGALAILSARFPENDVDDNLRILREVAEPFSYSQNGQEIEGNRLRLCGEYITGADGRVRCGESEAITVPAATVDPLQDTWLDKIKQWVSELILDI